MKLHSLISRCAAALLAAGVLAAPAHAAVVNGNFGAGLTGWATLGDVAAVNGATLTTASLDVDDAPAGAAAFNVSGTAAAPVGVPGGVESFVGLPLGGLDPDPASGSWAFEGSALKQTLAVKAGDTLSFDWLFSSQEDPLAGMNDFAFVLIGQSLFTLADVFGGATGSHFSTTFGADGNVDLAFGIVDVNDYVGTSSLSLANIRLAAANQLPEPGSLALGLGGLALLARRKLQK